MTPTIIDQEQVVSENIMCYNCGNKVIVYQYPSQYAGIWECTNCGFSDSCDHEHGTHREEVENRPTSPYDIDSAYLINVCDECGLCVESDDYEYDAE